LDGSLRRYQLGYWYPVRTLSLAKDLVALFILSAISDVFAVGIKNSI